MSYCVQQTIYAHTRVLIDRICRVVRSFKILRVAVYKCYLCASRVEFILLPTAILALVLNHEFSVMEVLWTFSIYLESLAILPQLFMVTKTGEAESITSHYLFALGLYRGLYILNWVYRYYFEGKMKPTYIWRPYPGIF